MQALRENGVAHEGTIQVDPVQTWVSRPAFEAGQLVPGSEADTVVWATAVQQAYEDSELNGVYLAFMTLATLLAGIAIILDSPILTIGAMVIGPEFGPIAALGVGLVRHRSGLFRRALNTLIAGFVTAIVITMLIAWLGHLVGWFSTETVTGPRPGTAFIYSPDRWSLVVAVIAAIAGVLSLTSSRTAGISGVFISVTTIPAAANIAVGLAVGSGKEVKGSALQLGVNIIAMIITGWLTLLIQQYLTARIAARRGLRALAAPVPGQQISARPDTTGG